MNSNQPTVPGNVLRISRLLREYLNHQRTNLFQRLCSTVPLPRQAYLAAKKSSSGTRRSPRPIGTESGTKTQGQKLRDKLEHIKRQVDLTNAAVDFSVGEVDYSFIMPLLTIDPPMMSLPQRWIRSNKYAAAHTKEA